MTSNLRNKMNKEIRYFVHNDRLYEFAGVEYYRSVATLFPVGHDTQLDNMDLQYVMDRIISAEEAKTKYPEFLL